MTAPARPAESVALEAGGSRVVVHPDGGRVTSLRLAGREWLGPAGLDEHLRATGAPPLAGAATARVDAPAGAAASVTRWADDALPYTFERTLTVHPDGSVRAEYALTARGAAPLVVRWGARAGLLLPPDTRLDLPVAARVRVWAERGVALGGRGAEHRWPVLRVGGRDATRFGPREVDFTFPALAPQRFGDGGGADYACAFVLDLPRAAGASVRIGVEQAGARLEVAADPALVPHAAVWVDRAAGTIAVTPASTAVPADDPASGSASGDVASDGWGPPVTLAPGESRRWALTWRGRAAPAGA